MSLRIYNIDEIYNDIEDLFLPEDHQALNIIFKYNGAIFGGYLRDIILGIEPNDIDAVISEQPRPGVSAVDFFDEMEDLGYDIRSDKGVFHLTKEHLKL